MTDTQAITVRLPEDIYEALRREAFENHVSQASIITEAVAERLGLRPEGIRHLPRMPISKEEFKMVMEVFTALDAASITETVSSPEAWREPANTLNRCCPARATCAPTNPVAPITSKRG